MQTIKNKLIEFESKNAWFDKFKNKIEIPFNDTVYIIKKEGLSCVDIDGIEYKLNEMSKNQIDEFWFLLPAFIGKIEK